jgi:hypothetical protein
MAILGLGKKHIWQCNLARFTTYHGHQKSPHDRPHVFLMFFSMIFPWKMEHICRIYPYMPFKNSKDGQLGTLPFAAPPFFPTLSGDLHGIQGLAADSRATWHETLKTSMVKNANCGISGVSMD